MQLPEANMMIQLIGLYFVDVPCIPCLQVRGCGFKLFSDHLLFHLNKTFNWHVEYPTCGLKMQGVVFYIVTFQLLIGKPYKKRLWE